ncbi:MAG TPA: bifunctional GNAT family N-acetyltransferase/NUDIX hydrolase [Nocardioidaceae bacterium]|nr:bifunctional GNAT family N-acetyltransferase/NUDIX hydrolase [Nocardioidaceae bacterium]
MPIVLKRVTQEDHDAFVALWQAAIDERRTQLGLALHEPVGSAIDRPGAFGVGVFDGDHMVSAAVAMPGRSDDGRGRDNVPGLAHISSVATRPDRWGEGLAGSAVRAVLSIVRRHGYARVQLWTHRDNERALRLYDHEGFVRSGREKVDDFGEPIVHLIRETPVAQATYRPAARLLCLDADADADHPHVLLMRWWDPADGYVLYEPPGGGIEPGEDPAEAVLREWSEETGLPAPEIVSGPTQVARDAFWGGGRLVSDEWFFLGRLSRQANAASTALTDQERVELLGREWVAVSELDSLSDPVVPDLIPILDRLRQSAPSTA